MVVVDIDAARRRKRSAFARLVLIASATAFITTIAVGAYWDHLTTFTTKAVKVARAVVSELAASDSIETADAAPTVDSDAVGAITQEAFVPQPRGQRVNQAFTICKGSKRVTCVVDGDTFWLNSEKIRIADIDTPEIGQPKCARELALGEKAKMRLRVLLSAGPFEMQSLPVRNIDRYGRSLRILVRNGQSVGDRLVSEGLARTWSGRREPWCNT
ncbi:thermonuclease family protein [Shinella sp.]|uniref:thermonuclease family protein n=1 Tax=Shinella sp. TaxID=1870904 RepID=UPI0029C0955B|nr:thermonuclease family protein [Shinella sp.]